MTKKPSKTLPLDVFDRIPIRSEHDLHVVMPQHPTHAAIRDTDKKIRKMLRRKPVVLECNADELPCLVDSESTIKAPWVEEHVPQYVGPREGHCQVHARRPCHHSRRSQTLQQW